MSIRRALTSATQLALLPLAACGGDVYGRVVIEPAGPMIEPALVVAGEGPPSASKRGPRDMVRVRAGRFTRGCSTVDTMCFENEHPVRVVDLPAYEIDRTEVTVAAYRQCVAAGACSTDGIDTHRSSQSTQNAPSNGHNTTRLGTPMASSTCNWGRADRDLHPINCASWDQARAFCAWAGKRLPTEAEWEKAARGGDERVYPWGDAPPSCHLAVMDEGGLGCGARTTAPVGSRPQGRSPAGALDMIGNVTEWVSDWYQEDYYASSPDVSPSGPVTGRFRVVRGGTWKNRIVGSINGLRISNRYSYVPGAHLDYVGFRCARDAR